jgi:hypothetical protein
MTLDVGAFAAKVNGELVGGRVIGLYGGKKMFLTAVGDDGQPFLTAEGLDLDNTIVTATEAEAPAPKKGRKKVEDTVSVDDVQIEV